MAFYTREEYIEALEDIENRFSNSYKFESDIILRNLIVEHFELMNNYKYLQRKFQRLNIRNIKLQEDIKKYQEEKKGV